METIRLLLGEPVAGVFHLIAGHTGMIEQWINLNLRIIRGKIIQICTDYPTAVQKCLIIQLLPILCICIKKHISFEVNFSFKYYKLCFQSSHSPRLQCYVPAIVLIIGIFYKIFIEEW